VSWSGKGGAAAAAAAVCVCVEMYEQGNANAAIYINACVRERWRERTERAAEEAFTECDLWQRPTHITR
jgi:hypothetical protein